MSRLRLCLLVIFIAGPSLAEAGNEEAVAVQGTEAEVTEAEVAEAEIAEPTVEEAEQDKVEVAELEEEPLEVKEPGLAEDKDSKQGEVNTTKPEDDFMDDPRSEDKQARNRPKDLKTMVSKAKSKPKKDIRVKAVQVHAKNIKNKEMHAYEDDESTEDDSSTYDESDEDYDEETLTRATCMNGLFLPKLRYLCCHNQMILDKDTRRCVDNRDTAYKSSRHKILSIRDGLEIIECVFARKKYIKSRDRLNVKRIQADAAKLGDPVRGEFMTKMYKTCGLIAKNAVKTFKKHRREIETQSEFRTDHEVFMFILFGCVDKYLQQHSCPYFHWYGTSSAKDAACLAYARECKRIVG